MLYQLEVVVLPVSDVDRSLAFYTEKLGFTLDVDHHPADDFRVVQLTPPGSSCSIQLEPGAGAHRSHYLVVPDIEAARRDQRDRGIEVADPEHRDYATFADIVDPDGHRWVLQERGHRA